MLTNVHLVKAMVLPVVSHGCESWNIKKAKHQRTESLEKTLILERLKAGGEGDDRR